MNHRLDNLTDCDGLMKHHQTSSNSQQHLALPVDSSQPSAFGALSQYQYCFHRTARHLLTMCDLSREEVPWCPLSFVFCTFLHYSLHLTSFGTSFGSFRLELQGFGCVQVMNILRVATAMKESRRHRFLMISVSPCLADN